MLYKFKYDIKVIFVLSALNILEDSNRKHILMFLHIELIEVKVHLIKNFVTI